MIPQTIQDRTIWKVPMNFSYRQDDNNSSHKTFTVNL